MNSNPVNAAEAAKFATRDAVFTAMNYDNLHPDEEDPDGHPKLTEYVIDFLKDNKIIK